MPIYEVYIYTSSVDKLPENVHFLLPAARYGADMVAGIGVNLRIFPISPSIRANSPLFRDDMFIEATVYASPSLVPVFGQAARSFGTICL